MLLPPPIPFVCPGCFLAAALTLITGGHHNTTARTVAIRRGEPINVAALTAILRHIIATNRAGGWRKIKQGE